MAANPVRTGIEGVALVTIAALVAAGWPVPVGSTLILGVAIILWIVGNFVLTRPDRFD